MNISLFEQMGAGEQVASIGKLKYGAEFVSTYHEKGSTFDFGEVLDKSFTYSNEVGRSEFDEILFKNAIMKGSRGYKGCAVKWAGFPHVLMIRRRHEGASYAAIE